MSKRIGSKTVLDFFPAKKSKQIPSREINDRLEDFETVHPTQVFSTSHKL